MRIAMILGPSFALLTSSLELSGCAHSSARTPQPLKAEPSTDVSFVALTRSEGLIGGEFRGTGTMRGCWMTVVVPTAQVTLPAGQLSRWQGLRVRALFVTDYSEPGGWPQPNVESRPVALWRSLRLPTDSVIAVATAIHVRDTLRFTVAVPVGLNLSRARVLFEIESQLVFGTHIIMGSNYAVSEPLTVVPPQSSIAIDNGMRPRGLSSTANPRGLWHHPRIDPRTPRELRGSWNSPDL
jgi:hypothetical protein